MEPHSSTASAATPRSSETERHRTAELTQANMMLQRVNQRLAAQTDYAAMLQLILAEVTRALGAARSLLFSRPDDSTLRLAYSLRSQVVSTKRKPTGAVQDESQHAVDSAASIESVAYESSENLQPTSFGAPGSLWPVSDFPAWPELLRKGELIFHDIVENPFLGSTLRNWMLVESDEVFLASSLLANGQSLGLLGLSFRKLRDCTPAQRQIFRAMAYQATLALLTTRLSDQAQHQAIQAATSDERSRLAREVHDTLAQGFTGILMQLGAASQVQGDSRAAVQPYMDSIESLAIASLSEARKSVSSLRPPASVLVDLAASIREHVEHLTKQTPVPLSLSVYGRPFPVAASVRQELLRIVQESLHNALKHAKAQSILLSIDFQDDRKIRLSISDDGRGFETESLAPLGRYGLLGMQERAAFIGASLTLVSEPNRGTSVIVQWPAN